MKIRMMIAAMTICALVVVSGCRSTSRRYYTTPVVTTPGCCNGQTTAPAPTAPLPPPVH